MELLLRLGRGPLFAAAFALMVLGIARLGLLTTFGIVKAYLKNHDRIVNWKEVGRQTLNWLFPANRLWRARPIYSAVSFIFHIGLILVPLFAAAHVLLWRKSLGFAWAAMPQHFTDWLTLLTLATGVGLLLGRLASTAARSISRPQEYFWLILLLIPFATGYACTHAALSSKTYEELMLLHLYSADLIMALIPFTKIAHCVLAPFSQMVTAVAWKFPAGAGDRVAATLGYGDAPTWLPKSRLEKSARQAVPEPISATPQKAEVTPAPQEVTVP